MRTYLIRGQKYAARSLFQAHIAASAKERSDKKVAANAKRN